MADFIVEMRAIVIRFYRDAMRIVGVGVERVQVRADALHGLEILILLACDRVRVGSEMYLHSSSAGFEHLVLERFRLACRFVGHGKRFHV